MADLLCYVVEKAMVSLVQAGIGAEANVFAGRSATDKAGPCVICEADGDAVEEDPKGTGNFWVTCHVFVKGSASTEANGVDPTPADAQLAKDVFNTVVVTDLDAKLNAQGQNLTVLPNGFIFESPRTAVDAQGVWIDEYPVRLYCCASVLPP